MFVVKSMPTINTTRGGMINVTAYNDFIHAEFSPAGFADTAWSAFRFSPATAAEYGAALIAAARAAGWVQPAVEVVREVEALDA